MKISQKIFLLFIVLFMPSCIEVYEIEEYQRIEYEPLENLGFEDGLNHWDGKTSIFSQISIDTISVEGNNSLKLSSSLSVVEDSLLSDTSIASISKGLTVKPGDTLKASFKYILEEQFIDGIKVYSSLSFSNSAYSNSSSFIFCSFSTFIFNVQVGTTREIVPIQILQEDHLKTQEDEFLIARSARR